MRLLPLALVALALAACDSPRYNRDADIKGPESWQYCCKSMKTGHHDQKPCADCGYCCNNPNASQCIEGYPPPARR